MGLLKKKFNLGSKVYGAYKFEVAGKITSCVILGAKNYAILSENEDGSVSEVCKIRGFSLTNEKTKRILNASVMKNLLLAWLQNETRSVQTENFSMKIDRKKQSVRNTTIVKNYRNDVYDKRYILPDPLTNCVMTAPYGACSLNFYDFRP